MKKQSDITKSKSGQVYCSTSCSVAKSNTLRTGENHPLFNDYGQDYRKKAFAHFNPCCEICGYSTLEVLHVHHKDENRSNNDLSNLIILCPTHHVEVHKGLRTV
jgi:5-methylcytosine-specific restriction endonuclease McrA